MYIFLFVKIQYSYSFTRQQPDITYFSVSDILMEHLRNAVFLFVNVLIVNVWCYCKPQYKQQQQVLENKEEKAVPGQWERLIPAGPPSWGTVKLEMIKAVLLLDRIQAGWNPHRQADAWKPYVHVAVPLPLSEEIVLCCCLNQCS